MDLCYPGNSLAAHTCRAIEDEVDATDCLYRQQSHVSWTVHCRRHYHLTRTNGSRPLPLSLSRTPARLVVLRMFAPTLLDISARVLVRKTNSVEHAVATTVPIIADNDRTSYATPACPCKCTIAPTRVDIFQPCLVGRILSAPRIAFPRGDLKLWSGLTVFPDSELVAAKMDHHNLSRSIRITLQSSSSGFKACLPPM